MRAWDLLTSAPLAIQVHLVTVVPAFFLGTWLIFVSRKGTWWHRRLGAVYLALMFVTAWTTLAIRSVDPPNWSPIHLFVPLTIGSTIWALVAVRLGNIRAHQAAMIGLYVGGLLIAGGLTFLPGRFMHRLVFG